MLYAVTQELMLTLLVGFGAFLFLKDDKYVLRLVAVALACIVIVNFYDDAIGLLTRHTG